MEDLAPPLKCLLEVRYGLENGASVLFSLKLVAKGQKGQLNKEIVDFLISYEKGDKGKELIGELKSPYRVALFEVFLRGLEGEPILNRLKELEAEMVQESHYEIEKKISDLPFITMIPLLLFQFPAFLILLFGPLLLKFMEGLNQ